MKDDDFERAKKLLEGCPDGLNVKMIRNGGESEIYKIINTGAENVHSFLDSFSRHCFSTCSKTHRGILYNREWAEDDAVKAYVPTLLKIKTVLMKDAKEKVWDDIDWLIAGLLSEGHRTGTGSRKLVIQSLLCMSKIFKVYRRDSGEKEISEALEIAKALNNDVLLAHVYRYAYFFSDMDENTKIYLLNQAENTFKKYKIDDHAIYCRNNALIRQFYGEEIDLESFIGMQQYALHNTPGLVGMSYILNNTGVAHLYAGRCDLAIEYFKKGLAYADHPDRRYQRVALITNSIIAKDADYQK